MGRPRGSKNKCSSWAGDRFSVYLSRRAIRSLVDECMRDGSVAVFPDKDKGLTIPRLIAECVDYVIDEGKLQHLPSIKRK